MQIILMRHGKPKVDRGLRLNARAFGAWVEQYDAAGIDPECKPPHEAVIEAQQCAFVVCSDLPRAVESARALGVERIGVNSGLFREMDMPHAQWRFPRLPLPVWLVFFRLAWVLGYGSQVASFELGKVRAQRCAQALVRLASIHGRVLLIGHGVLNRFIARDLRRMGWRSIENPTQGYWEYRIFCSHLSGHEI